MKVDVGGVWSDGFSSFSGCEFIGNTAVSAGALLSFGVETTFDHCQFIGITATGGVNVGFGGAVFAGDFDFKMTVQKTVFKCNSARVGGAMVFFPDGKLSMDDVEISANTAVASGGGLVTLGGVSDFNNCRFRQNTAGSVGGAILTFAEINLNENVFQNNGLGSALGLDVFSTATNDVECGNGYGNCFCDADNTNGISTNDPSATCAGDGVGPDCEGCNPSAAPIVCSGDNGPIGAVAVSTRAEESSPPEMDIVDMAEKLMERIKRKHPGQNRRQERAI